MKWFGAKPTHADCDEQVEVPITKTCAHCEERFQPDDYGVYLETGGPGHGEEPCHTECFFRIISGSIGHMQRRCNCYGMEDTSEDGLTLRQAALAAWDYYRMTRRQNSRDSYIRSVN